MANWTNLSAAFAFGTKLTSQQQQQLRDNITALAENASGAPEINRLAIGGYEAGGGNDYYNSGDFGGANKNSTALSWEKLCEVRCVLQGTYRFYWRYRQDFDDHWGYWRILLNL